jgi:hypothetical protein
MIPKIQAKTLAQDSLKHYKPGYVKISSYESRPRC